jgi:hypothetical protein
MDASSLTKLNDKNMGKRLEWARQANESTANAQLLLLRQVKGTLDEHTGHLEVQSNTTMRLAERM